jgi:hypothetical protein
MISLNNVFASLEVGFSCFLSSPPFSDCSIGFKIRMGIWDAGFREVLVMSTAHAKTLFDLKPVCAELAALSRTNGCIACKLM